MVADFAYPLPATIIAVMLGVPTGDPEAFKRWSDAIAGSFAWAPDTMRLAHRGFVELTGYVAELAARRSLEAGRDAAR